MSPESWRNGDGDRIKKMWDDIYYGNGKPGLTTRMSDMEKDVKLILEREAERSKKMQRIELAVWVAVVAAIINILTSHIN